MGRVRDTLKSEDTCCMYFLRKKRRPPETGTQQQRASSPFSGVASSALSYVTADDDNEVDAVSEVDDDIQPVISVIAGLPYMHERIGETFRDYEDESLFSADYDLDFAEASHFDEQSCPISPIARASFFLKLDYKVSEEGDCVKKVATEGSRTSNTLATTRHYNFDMATAFKTCQNMIMNLSCASHKREQAIAENRNNKRANTVPGRTEGAELPFAIKVLLIGSALVLFFATLLVLAVAVQLNRQTKTSKDGHAPKSGAGSTARTGWMDTSTHPSLTASENNVFDKRVFPVAQTSQENGDDDDDDD